MPVDQQPPRPPAGLTEPLWATATYDPHDQQVVIVPDDGREPIVLPAVDRSANLHHVLAYEGWEPTLGPGDPPAWKDGERATRVARGVLPAPGRAEPGDR